MDKRDVLRYLAYDNQALDKDMHGRLDRAISTISRFQGSKRYQIFDFEVKDRVYIKNTLLKLEGASISHMLSKAKQVLLFTVTLGPEVDQLIFKASYQSKVDMMILDACASVRIEEILDDMQEALPGYKTPRFSPGYGDLPLEIQKNIVEVLQARRIGVTVTPSSILMPKKTVTGIIGLSDQAMDIDYLACDDCIKRHDCDHKICTRENI